ncbi:MAG TPA: fibronectin type III domain-containing protein, partial [Steroidobacteraceae bacterium]|nr:fibronectin type III domain-containing protein [Steroidobacteraceae bacterium]
GMTQEWADQLLDLGYPADLPLSFNRVSGAVSYTLGQLAAQASGTARETFHFVLNNTVLKDNRIPTYGMSVEEARKRNALPVPADQYGGTGGTYQYWDELALDPPTDAFYAEISLLYQPTSWEYVQFLYLANRRENAFLADEGVNLLDAWLATGMAEPYVMASATWGEPVSGGGGGEQCSAPGAPTGLAASAGKKSVTLDWSAANPAPTTGGYNVYFDQSGKLQLRGSVSAATLSYKDTGLTSRMTYTYLVTAWNDCDGNGSFDFGTDLEGPASDPATATAR